MCIIAWNWQPASDTPLLLLSNRDEFYARPCEALHWWATEADGEPTILAGRDLQAGGTWLGMSRSGRLAALTNFRQVQPLRSDAPSRGALVTNFLNSPLDSSAFLQQLSGQVGDYNPFNLLVFDGNTLMGLESRDARMVALQPGLGGVSNAGFNTPWPKLQRLQQGLHKQMQRSPVDPPTLHDLQTLLYDRTPVPDADLPQTGVPLELERALSPIFIATPHYGTRACNVVHVHRQHATFVEQTVNASGLQASQNQTFSYASAQKTV